MANKNFSKAMNAMQNEGCTNLNSRLFSRSMQLLMLVLTFVVCLPLHAKVQTVNGKTYNVIYMSSAGAGNKSGDDTANAVSGWANAYNKLSKTGGTYEDDWNYNIIVIVGSTNIQINTTEANTKSIPATITNVWPWENEDGISAFSGSQVSNGCKLTLNGTARACRIGAPTRFKNVCFTSGGSDCRMCLFFLTSGMRHPFFTKTWNSL